MCDGSACSLGDPQRFRVGESVTGTQLFGEPLTGTVTTILARQFLIVKDGEGREWLTTASRVRKIAAP